MEREGQEGREKKSLREQEKGMLKVITSSSVPSSSLLIPTYYLKVAAFLKSNATRLCVLACWV